MANANIGKYYPYHVQPRKKVVEVKTFGIDIGYDSPYFVRRYIWGRDGRANKHDHFPADFNDQGPGNRIYGATGMYGGFHPGRHYRPMFQSQKRGPSNFRYGNRNSYLVSHSEDAYVKPKVITVVRNGPRPRNIVKILLNKRSVQSFEHLLKDISESFGPKWKNNKVRKIFNTKGREVLGVSDFFREEDLFIAIGTESLSVSDIADVLEEIYPDSPYAKNYLRDWEKQKRRRRRDQAKEPDHHETKGDSGFVESESGKDDDGVIYKPQPFDGSPSRSPYLSKFDNAKERDILVKLDNDRKKHAEDDRMRARRRREKQLESERRAIEDERRRRNQIANKDLERERERKMAEEAEEAKRKELEEKRRRDEEERKQREEDKRLAKLREEEEEDKRKAEAERRRKEVAEQNKENEHQKSKDSIKQKRRGSKARRRSVSKPPRLQRQVSNSQHVLDKYDAGRVLGDGNFAVVKQCRMKSGGSGEYAMKIIDKSKLKGKEHMIESEIEIMKRCNHPNLVKLREEFETKSEIYLIMELVKGGDLFDAITQSVKFAEKESAMMVKDLASALFYMHSRNIVHRDMKPENLLVQRNKDNTMTLKLADFGLAMDVRAPIFTVCGTPTYVAPEILSEIGYGLEVDMWALGVITYILLCGFPPFRSPDRNQTELFEFIKAGEYEFLAPYWDKVSKSAQDLIQNLLVVDKRKRYTAIDVLCHPWVVTLASSVTPPENMAEYRKKLREELKTHADMALESYKKLYYPSG